MKESKPFYHTAAWKKVRAAALARDDGMCQDCMDRMRSGVGIRPNRATMVHHIIPYTQRPDLALQLDNLRSLCNECHEKNHPERRAQKKRKTLERTGSHSMRVVKV
jgi:5-methylcytosine-specific restriction endonuclease McrA